MFIALGGKARGLKIYDGPHVNSAVASSLNFSNIYFLNTIIMWAFLFSPHLSFLIWSVDGEGILLGSDWLLICHLHVFAGKWSQRGYLHLPLHSTGSMLMEEVGTMMPIWCIRSALLNVFVQPGWRKLLSLFKVKDACNLNFSVLLVLDSGKEFANSTMFWLHCLIWGLKLSWDHIC